MKNKGVRIMRQVGIVTLFKVHNLGAVLQAYAMKTAIENLGYKPIFINSYDKKFSMALFRGDMKGLSRIYTIPHFFKKYKKFRNCFSLFKTIDSVDDDIRNMHAIVLGSDSIWTPSYANIPTPPTFFGGEINNKHIFTYAVSSGGIEDINLYSKYQLQHLQKLQSISVRDNTTKNFIINAIGHDSIVVPDPTLLVDWKRQESIQPISCNLPQDRYILVYGCSRINACAIKRFAKKNGYKKIINIGPFSLKYPLFAENLAVSPLEFVEYIRNADLVFSGMFHGVMMSIALKKDFYYMSIDENRDKKLSTTLEILGMKDRVIHQPCEWPANFTCCKYDMIQNGLSKFRRQGMEFIQENLEQTI